MIPGKGEHPKFLESFKYAFKGVMTCISYERNIKVMLLGGVLAVGCGFVLKLDPISWAVILTCCGSVLCAEMLNTAIENVVDLVSPEMHPLAGRAKDIAAGAVLILSIFTAIIGLIIFVNAYLNL